MLDSCDSMLVSMTAVEGHEDLGPYRDGGALLSLSVGLDLTRLFLEILTWSSCPTINCSSLVLNLVDLHLST